MDGSRQKSNYWTEGSCLVSQNKSYLSVLGCKLQSELAEHTKLEGNIPAEMAGAQSQGWCFEGRRSSGDSHQLTSCAARLVVASRSSHAVRDGGGGGRIGMESEVMSLIRPADRPRKNKHLGPSSFSRLRKQQ